LFSLMQKDKQTEIPQWSLWLVRDFAYIKDIMFQSETYLLTLMI
jgi:hypothetical protein